MRFEPDDLTLLDETEEIVIETAAPGGSTHRTIIWVVVEGGEVFVRSVNGATARWYREATAHPAVTIHVGGRALAAIVSPATDPDPVERTNAALARKYAADPAVRPMLLPEIFDTTLRVSPA
jgi:hypothetical protein